MNPPAALHGAMSRDRKPFTYTPGGLDLSEIKSSRMAARLMRNAMNEGVPEVPKQSTQPSMTSNPIAVPNFNCLPVQVFPTFNLPANPKSLLRTRSNPGQPKDLPVQKTPQQPSQFINNSKISGMTHYDAFNKNTTPYSQVNNNRPVSMFEYGSTANTFTPSYANDAYSSTLPEMSYEAEYFRAPPLKNVDNEIYIDTIKNENKTDNNLYSANTNQFIEAGKACQEYCENDRIPLIENKDPVLPVIDTSKFDRYSEMIIRPEIDNKEIVLPSIEINEKQVNFADNKEKEDDYSELIANGNNENKCESSVKEIKSDISNKNDFRIHDLPANKNNKTLDVISLKPILDYSTFGPETKVSMPSEEHQGPENQKQETKVVEKQVVVNSKNSVENQNGSSDQNGDSEVEAVVKLPSKKSAAKTETKVEVTKKTLPDGSIEEVKKTITKTTIDGRTEIKTKTETTIIPKEDEEDEIEEVEEEEEENGETTEEKVVNEPEVAEVKKSTEIITKSKENGQESITKTEEKSETTTTSIKKEVVIQDEKDEEKEKEKEILEEEQTSEEPEPVTFVIKQPTEKSKSPEKEFEEPEEEQEEEEVEEVIVEEETKIADDKKVVVDKNNDEEEDQKTVEKEVEDEEVEEEDEYEEAEAKEMKNEVIESTTQSQDKRDDNEPDAIQTEIEIKKDDVDESTEKSPTSEENIVQEEQTQGVTVTKQESVDEKQENQQETSKVQEEHTIKIEKLDTTENKQSLREPSVPLEKVEDVEIKPIGLGDYLTRTSTEKTEIITNVSDKPSGLLTEINRIENIVTVNRTTKTLDRAYEDITQQGIPTLKTYFTPHIDKISTSPQPSRPYQPVYPPEPPTERRHSLLLDRLSVERQMPSDIYQNNYQYSNQSIEQQRQWSQEPQAEVLSVSNVKPSQITNQQWYQQRENAIYNNVEPSLQPTQPVAPAWNQAKPQTQPLYQPQPQYQHSPQPQYQAPPQPLYQAPPQPQYQAPIQPKPQYQPSYSENIQEKSSSTFQNTYSTYTPQPSSWTPSTKPLSPIPTIITPSQPSPYSYLSKDSSESYQQTTQNYLSSSYVPPPWEQDSSYVPPETPQNYYQPPPQTSSFSSAPNKGWKSNLPTSKYSKPPPTAYIPPKPNQSFVAPVAVTDLPKIAGRKTYYSEYERRYISVPESTYIPGENKFQPQPDASPAYYYDNNEPTEATEPQWRRELREFTEKSQTQTTTETNVKPPWEAEHKFAKAPEPSYTQTPTWSQTVRPQSWRERSFESEFVSQEWPKTNTLGRGRPLSSYGKETIPERTRGVSVDRYNPNNYQAPIAAEHPPVQTHTHVPLVPHATGYHNPNVPAYHSRASAEPREQASYQQPRHVREARASPFQSRSFKYLQWITGTDD